MNFSMKFSYTRAFFNMSKKALVKKISMLKSNYVEAGREQPGYKILIHLWRTYKVVNIDFHDLYVMHYNNVGTITSGSVI